MNKKNFKNLLVLCTIMVTITIALCACLPEKTFKVDLQLWCGQPSEYSLGEFNVISIDGDYNKYELFGLRKSDRDDFIKTVESSPLCGGKVTLKDSYATDFLNERNENVGNECYVISCEEYLWLGRFYMDKYFKITYLWRPKIIRLHSQDIFEINELLLSPTDTDKFLEGVEYSTPWTWEELKIFFHFAQIDEDNHTFVFSQKDYSDGYTTAQITYNEQNSTLCVRQID